MVQTHDGALLLVAEAVSNALGTPIEDLPPLSEAISLEGLEAIVNDGNAADASVTFSYAGLRVFVHSDGLVYVRPAWEEEAPRLGGMYVHGR